MDVTALRPTGDGSASSVVGDLRVVHGIAGPPHGPDRDLLVHLPAGAAASGRRYPVLYVHDGQSMFAAPAGDDGWAVDETLALLAAEGIELIAVGIPNAGDGRYAEYTPYRGRRKWATGGNGRAYLRWLVEVVKPVVDATFPTDPGRESTGILGSSLGALISLWAAIAHPGEFGLVGAMSPAITPGQNAVIRRLGCLRLSPVRAYLYVGGHEANDAPTPGLERQWSAAILREARQLREALVASGLREPETLRYLEDPDGIHRAANWARRLPGALRFLYGSLDNVDANRPQGGGTVAP